jgi:hypothetical protein
MGHCPERHKQTDKSRKVQNTLRKNVHRESCMQIRAKLHKNTLRKNVPERPHHAAKEEKWHKTLT